MSGAPLPCWLLAHREGCVVLISAQPGARRSELAGLHDGTLRVRVAAPPLEGRANAALCEWLAGQLQCANKHVRLLRGDKSRRKQLLVELPPAQVLARIEPLLAQAQ
jgi:uncharacterized protein (TIGR00251 family)